MSKYAPHRQSANNPRANSSTLCQKCLKRGHFTYQCNNARPYVSRPSRTQMLEKPALLAKFRTEGNTSVEVPDQFKNKSGTADKILEAKERERAAQRVPVTKKRKRSGSSTSGSASNSGSSSSDSSESGSSDSESDSNSQSESGSSRSSSRSRARERRRRGTRTRSRSISHSGSSVGDASPKR